MQKKNNKVSKKLNIFTNKKHLILIKVVKKHKITIN